MNKINLHDLLIELSIGNEEFFKFLRGKVVKLPLGAQDFSWGCFPITDDNEILTDIRLLVPKIVDKPTLMVNIHEYAHAYELYQVIGKKYIENVIASEEFAKSKELESELFLK